MSENGEKISKDDVLKARDVILNPEGNLPNCLMIDDPLIEAMTPEMEEKVRKSWEDFLALGRALPTPKEPIIIKGDVIREILK